MGAIHSVQSYFHCALLEFIMYLNAFSFRQEDIATSLELQKTTLCHVRIKVCYGNYRAIVCPELPGETDQLMIIFSSYINTTMSIHHKWFIKKLY